MKRLMMAVRFYLCFSIILIFCMVKSESSVNFEYGKCFNDFTDIKGNKIDLEKQCNFKTCVPKCCGENEILFNNNTVMFCIRTTELKDKLSKRINMNLTIYKDVGGKYEESIRHINDDDIVFIRNKKLYQKDCYVKAFEVDHFHIFENSSLIIEEQKDKLKGYVDMKNYCMEHIVHSTGTEMKGPAFYFKWVISQPPKRVCEDKFTDLGGKPINVKDYCNNTHCIAKCCREANRILYYTKNETVKCEHISKIEELTNTSINVNYSKINIYGNNIEQNVNKSHMKFGSYFHMIMNKKLSHKDCVSGIPEEPMNNFYILENNSLVMELPNFYKRFVRSWPMGDFCLEHLVINTKEEVRGPFVIYRYVTSNETAPAVSTSEAEDIFKSVALLISCLFLIVVLCVYGVIRELRNLVGMVLMAYVGTLALTFFLKAVEHIAVLNNVMTTIVCKPMSVFLYYTTISSFFWMNIMSFDIWWTFRGIFKSRPIHRRGELAKFMWYALYSWGVPLLLTIAVAVIDYSDLSHLPHIYKPHFQFCFYIKDNQIEIRHYLYMPILGLLLLNCTFFLMTAFNIWRIRKSMAQFSNEASKYNNNQNRLGLYLKLSLVMGISWVLEVISLPWYLERASSAYNALIGVAIFFIFIFKRKVLIMLCRRFSSGESPEINKDENKALTKKNFFLNFPSRISNPGPLEQQAASIPIKLFDLPITDSNEAFKASSIKM